jgi:hypothetical protein
MVPAFHVTFCAEKKNLLALTSSGLMKILEEQRHGTGLSSDVSPDASLVLPL